MHFVTCNKHILIKTIKAHNYKISTNLLVCSEMAILTTCSHVDNNSFATLIAFINKDSINFCTVNMGL